MIQVVGIGQLKGMVIDGPAGRCAGGAPGSASSIACIGQTKLMGGA